MTVDPELALLRRLWDVVWNETASYDDGGPHSLMAWADAARITEAASAVEDHYAEHGFPADTGALQ